MGEIVEHLYIHHSFDPQIDEVLFAGQAQTDANHQMGPRIHPYYVVHHVLSGKGEMTVGGNTYYLQSGDSFFIFPDESVHYAADKDDPWRYSWIGFKGSRVKQLLAYSHISIANPIVRKHSSVDIYTHFHKIMQALSANEYFASIEANGYLHLLLAAYNKVNTPHLLKDFNKISVAQHQIDDLITYIDFNYTQALTIEALAERIGYHRSYLTKLFKQATGLSPLAYLTKVRLEQAKMLLTQHISVSQTAQAVGFSDPLYFSRLFKQHFGISPSLYEKKYGHR